MIVGHLFGDDLDPAAPHIGSLPESALSAPRYPDAATALEIGGRLVARLPKGHREHIDAAPWCLGTHRH